MQLFDYIKNLLIEANAKERLSIVYSYYNSIFGNKDLQEFLARDESERVRMLIFMNTRNQNIISIGKDDNSVVIRTIVAEKSMCPETLAFLAKDPSIAVRRIVAKNKFITTETIKKIASDPSISVKYSLLENPKEQGLEFAYKAFIESNISVLTLKILDKRDLPRSVFDLIAENRKKLSALVIQRMLAHSSAPIEILEDFFDSNPDFVIKNRNLNSYTKDLLSMVIQAKKEGLDLSYSDLFK